MGAVCSTFVVGEGFAEYDESMSYFPCRAVRVLTVLPCGLRLELRFLLFSQERSPFRRQQPP
jgi:hypothetical protein